MKSSGNLGDVFSAHGDSNDLAVIDFSHDANPRETSYVKLTEGCNSLARGLKRSGFKKGSRIGILALNRLEFLEVLFGSMRAGCVPVLINAKLPFKQVQYIISDANAQIVFGDENLRKLCSSQTRYISFDNGNYSDFKDHGPFESYQPNSDDIAEQPYTSGSTGYPKGVLLHHFGQRWMIDRLVESRSLVPEDCGIISAPLYHKNALLAVKSALQAAGRIVLLPKFDVRKYIKYIEKYKITMLTGVPTMYALMLQQEKLISTTDISSVRSISMGSAPASEVLLDQLQDRFPDARINLNYGITEGGPILFSWKHPDGLERPRTTVGFPIDGVEITLEDGPNEYQGILKVRSPGVMLGYHNLPEATKRDLKDGWLNTGDILRRDEHGWYYFIGRADDMFVTGGENIYPGDVEAMLERHEDIMQAVVVPAPNILKAHVPHAFIVVKEGSNLNEKLVKEYALKNAPPYAHPRRVFIMEHLPLSGTNKIDRRKLLEIASKAAEKDGTA
ncbi:MAG: long-chain fatty acid--CoA ligase [Rhodospirillaceae bacterium]|nr:long-chain fatty acid--CoA ligase [Rhodospirillaceae bacterium]